MGQWKGFPGEVLSGIEGESSPVKDQVERLAAGGENRAEVLRDLQSKVDDGTLSMEDAIQIGEELGAFPDREVEIN